MREPSDWLSPAHFMRGALAALCAWICSATVANASPWARDQGEAFLISQARYFTTSPQDEDIRRFERLESDLYLEFGLTSAVTLGAKAVYGTSWLTRNGAVETISGFSEVGGFGQYELRRTAADAFSLRLSVIAPSDLGAGVRQGLQSDGVDVETAALYGRNLSSGPVKTFLALNAGYRKRFGDAADQLRAQATLGAEPGERWLLLADIFVERSLRNATDGGADFDIIKVQPSIVYRFGEGPKRRWAAQAGMTEEIAGRNLSLGRAAFVSLWSAF